MGESDYSFSLTTFSPSGRLVQIEYALNAVTAGATALGIKGKPPSIIPRPIPSVHLDPSSPSTNTLLPPAHHHGNA